MTACTTTEHGPHRTASPVNTADWPVAASATAGPTEIEVHKPDGARSLHVDFSCLGGGVFDVAVNQRMDAYGGSCLGMQNFVFSTTDFDDGASVRINVQVHDDVHFVLRGTFSPLVNWMTGDGDHPGGYRNAPLGDFTAARALIGQICSANGTPIVVRMKYGG
jgi:hypothetical protein